MTKFDKILYRIVYYGLFLAVFVPLVVFRNSFSPFNFGKVIVFRTLIELLTALSIFLFIKYPNLRPWHDISWRKIKNPSDSKSVLLGLLTLFTILYFLSSLLGLNWHQSFWGYWERMGGLFSWLHYYAYFLMIISYFRSRRDWISLFWLSVVSALFSTTYGFLQKFNISGIPGATERLRILGTLGNPAAFGSYLLFNFYFCFYLFSVHKRKKTRIFLVIIALVFVSSIILTAVRGALLALIVSLLVLLIFKIKHLSRKKALLISTISVVILGIFLHTSLIKESNYFKRLFVISLRQETIQQRFLVWRMAFDSLKERPLLGVGPENFTSVFSTQYSPKFYREQSDVVFDRAHNFVLDIASTQGILAMTVWLVVLGFIFRRAHKERILPFAVLIVAYAINNFFFFDLFSSFLMLIIVFGFFSVGLNNREIFYKATVTTVEKSIFSFIKIAILLGLALATIFYTNIKPALANFYSTRGAVYLNRGNGAEGLKYFNLAFENSLWSKPDISKKFAESYIDYVFQDKQFLKKEEGQKAIKNLIVFLEDELNKNSWEFPSYIYLAKTYRAEDLLSGLARDREEDLLKKVSKALPKTIPVHHQLFDFYVEKNDINLALGVIEYLYELNQSPEIKYKLGLARVLNSLKLKESETSLNQNLEIILESFKSGYYNINEINFLSKQLQSHKKFHQLASLYKELVSRNKQYLVSLSYVYLLSGDKKNAIFYADKALESTHQEVSPNGFKFLSSIYQALGDNKKRSEAFLKSTP